MSAPSTARSVAGPLEPATQAFVDSLAGGKPIYTLSPEAARDVLAGAQKSVSVTLAPASERRVGAYLSSWRELRLARMPAPRLRRSCWPSSWSTRAIAR
jgi:hypothetical protein